jgi:anti-anti-sigma factor
MRLVQTAFPGVEILERRSVDDIGFSVQQVGAATVATLQRRRITGEGSRSPLWSALGELGTQGQAGLLVLDFSQVQYVASQALGGLVMLAKQCRAAGRQLHLCGLCPSILEVLELMKLDKALKIYPDVTEALAG